MRPGEDGSLRGKVPQQKRCPSQGQEEVDIDGTQEVVEVGSGH